MRIYIALGTTKKKLFQNPCMLNTLKTICILRVHFSKQKIHRVQCRIVDPNHNYYRNIIKNKMTRYNTFRPYLPNLQIYNPQAEENVKNPTTCFPTHVQSLICQ